MDTSTTAKIAWRNIWRNRTRTILTTLAIAFATGVLVFFVSLQLSSYATSIQATIRLFQGHIQVQRQGYLDEPRMRTALSDVEMLRATALDLPGVTAAALRSTGFAMVSSAERSYGVSIVGVEPQREMQVSSIPGVVRRGRYLSPATGDSVENLEQPPAEAVLGSYLAANLQVDVGDELTLLGQGYDGSLAAGVLTVVGIFETGSNEIDRNLLQIPRSTFNELFFFGEQAHALVLSLERLEQVAAVEKLLEQEFTAQPQIDVLRWDELVPGLKEAIELDMASGWLFYLSLIIIVGFSVTNTFWMAVLERTKEFAILLALGTRPGQIVRMVVLECALLTVVGIGLGIAFGSMLISYFGAYGFSVPGSEEVVKRWNIPAVVFTKFSWEALTQGPLVLWLVAVCAVFYPAARILRLQPVQALSGRN